MLSNFLIQSTYSEISPKIGWFCPNFKCEMKKNSESFWLYHPGEKTPKVFEHSSKMDFQKTPKVFAKFRKFLQNSESFIAESFWTSLYLKWPTFGQLRVSHFMYNPCICSILQPNMLCALDSNYSGFFELVHKWSDFGCTNFGCVNYSETEFRTT